MDSYRSEVTQIVRERGLREFNEPVELASGSTSRHFVDGKRALSRGRDLATASQALLELTREMEIDFDVVGGLTMGADAFAHQLSVLADKSWFSVRKAPKGRGTNQRIEGATLDKDVRVLLVDDVVTTGGSIRQACDAIEETGAQVVAAIALVDRSDVTEPIFRQRGIPYRALVTYTDLGIDPVQPQDLVDAR